MHVRGATGRRPRTRFGCNPRGVFRPGLAKLAGVRAFGESEPEKAARPPSFLISLSRSHDVRNVFQFQAFRLVNSRRPLLSQRPSPSDCLRPQPPRLSRSRPNASKIGVRLRVFARRRRPEIGRTKRTAFQRNRRAGPASLARSGERMGTRRRRPATWDGRISWDATSPSSSGR